MSDVLADTHTVLWQLFDPTKLSGPAKAALVGAVQSGGSVMISGITPVEVRFLVDKFKLPASHFANLLGAILDPKVRLEVLPVDLAVAQAMDQIPRTVVPDMPDRIIAATALVHQLRVVTCDPKIQSSAVSTIW